MQKFVALYQVRGETLYKEFEAASWMDAYNVWVHHRPVESVLRLIAEREGFDWQIVHDNRVVMDLVPRGLGAKTS